MNVEEKTLLLEDVVQGYYGPGIGSSLIARLRNR